MRPKSTPFVAAFLLPLCITKGIADEQCDPPATSLDAAEKYKACMATQGPFGNWKVTHQCVADFREECLSLEGGGTKFCAVTRTTSFRRGACLQTGCPEGNCTALPFGPCTGTTEVLRDLFGTLDESDEIDCCEGIDECSGSPVVRIGMLPFAFALLFAVFN